jgi:hypothetical protein
MAFYYHPHRKRSDRVSRLLAPRRSGRRCPAHQQPSLARRSAVPLRLPPSALAESLAAPRPPASLAHARSAAPCQSCTRAICCLLRCDHRLVHKSVPLSSPLLTLPSTLTRRCIRMDLTSLPVSAYLRLRDTICNGTVSLVIALLPPLNRVQPLPPRPSATNAASSEVVSIASQAALLDPTSTHCNAAGHASSPHTADAAAAPARPRTQSDLPKTHLRRLRSTSSRGRHSRCLCGPGDGLGACEWRRRELSGRVHGLLLPCCRPPRRAPGTLWPQIQAKHDARIQTNSHQRPLAPSASGDGAQQQEGSCCCCRCAACPPGSFCLQHPLESLKRALYTTSDPRTLTKMPPSLSSIQWLGAFSRFMCFLGPRTMVALFSVDLPKRARLERTEVVRDDGFVLGQQSSGTQQSSSECQANGAAI